MLFRSGGKPHATPGGMSFGEEGERFATCASASAGALLCQGEEEKAARVAGRALGGGGSATGQASKSPALSAMACNAELPGGMAKEYAASAATEAALRHCDGREPGRAPLELLLAAKPPRAPCRSHRESTELGLLRAGMSASARAPRVLSFSASCLVAQHNGSH